MTQTNHDNPLLGAVRALVHDELAPLAGRVDREGLYPEQFLGRLGTAGGFGVCIPKDQGGAGRQLSDQIDVTAAVAEECGSTAFLVWCQSVSAWYLLLSRNAAVRQRYLPAVARGTLLSGSGMSNTAKHLAGIEKIHLQARREGPGFRINGILPWVSNLGSGHLLITAAQVAGGGYVTFVAHCDAPGLSLHPCPPFSGMEGTGTFNPRFRDVRIEAADVIATPAQFDAYMARIKPGFILGQVGMGIGIVAGCLKTIHKYDATLTHVNGFLDDQESDLRSDMELLRQRAHDLAERAQTGQVALVEILKARAWASELALRAANSAILHAGARGYLMSNPAQRRLREAIFVAIVTPALKHLRKEIHDLEHAGAGPAACREQPQAEAA